MSRKRVGDEEDVKGAKVPRLMAQMQALLLSLDDVPNAVTQQMMSVLPTADVATMAQVDRRFNVLARSVPRSVYADTMRGKAMFDALRPQLPPHEKEALLLRMWDSPVGHRMLAIGAVTPARLLELWQLQRRRVFPLPLQPPVLEWLTTEFVHPDLFVFSLDEEMRVEVLRAMNLFTRDAPLQNYIAILDAHRHQFGTNFHGSVWAGLLRQRLVIECGQLDPDELILMMTTPMASDDDTVVPIDIVGRPTESMDRQPHAMALITALSHLHIHGPPMAGIVMDTGNPNRVNPVSLFKVAFPQKLTRRTVKFMRDIGEPRLKTILTIIQYLMREGYTFPTDFVEFYNHQQAVWVDAWQRIESVYAFAFAPNESAPL